MRLISFSMTTPQFINGSKDVTRRYGWWKLKPGDKLVAVEKAQGLPKEEKVKRIGIIEIVSVRAEPLSAMTDDLPYGFEEIRREGFPFNLHHPLDFVRRMCWIYKVQPETLFNRIEFKKIEG